MIVLFQVNECSYDSCAKKSSSFVRIFFLFQACLENTKCSRNFKIIFWLDMGKRLES